IYDFTWINDFSAARNFAFSKASGDYILWLDADDIIDEKNRARLLSLKKRLSETRAPAAFCRYETGGENGESCQTAFYRTRIIKNDGSAVWSGRVHECLPQFKDALCDTENGFTVRHLGSKKPRGTRNLDIYRYQALSGEPFSTRDLFYYGRELFYHGFYTEADAIEEEFTRRTDGWYVNKIEARKIQAACREAKGDISGAKNALFSSFSYGAPRAGVLCALGRLFKNEKDFSSAYFWYHAAYLADDHSAEGDFENPAERTSTPLLEMVCCAYFAGDEALSRKWHGECLRVCSDYPSVQYNQNFFSSQ
ncbi:MAG: glycosyltransferase, partial [Candidatus Scatosoma sp.]